MLGITGGSGFVGKSFIKLIKEQNISYRSFVRKPCLDKSSYTIGDISSDTDWHEALSQTSVLIHLASVAHGNAQSVLDYEKVNFLGTLNLAKQAADAGVKRFIFISSIGVLGNSSFDEKFKEDNITNPQNNYTKSKFEAEKALVKLSVSTNMEVVIIRPPLVYGVGAPGNFGALTRLIDKFPLLPFGLVCNHRDFISVQNLAHLLSICASHPDAAGHTFLASENETVSTKEFTNAIAKGLGKKVYQLPVPVSLMRFAGKLLGKSAIIEQLVGNLQVDSSDLRKVLGWTPPYTMEESMALLKEQSKERE